MSGQYPPLDYLQVTRILTVLKFKKKPGTGTSHEQWEGYTKGKRRLVTVDRKSSKKEKYGDKLLGDMIRQSGLSKKEFYLSR